MCILSSFKFMQKIKQNIPFDLRYKRDTYGRQPPLKMNLYVYLATLVNKHPKITTAKGKSQWTQ